MLRFLTLLSASGLCLSCMHHPVIQDSSAPPIDAVTPMEGIPLATAWSDETQLMMGLDTGAVQHSLLFSPSVESLGARVRGRRVMRYAKVPIALKEGGEPNSSRVDVVMVESAPIDGLIGWECLKKYVWNINYPKRTHRFFNQLPPRIKKWNKVSLIAASDYPQLHDRYGRRIILDTGAPYAVYVSAKAWDQVKQNYPDAVISVYSGYSPAAGGNYAHECMLVKNFKLGDLTFENAVICESFANPTVAGLPNDIDIILGAGALASREFWIDGPGNTLYYSSVAHPVPVPNDYNLVGATFIRDKDGNGPYKAFVADWSPAWYAGLRTDDTLLSINGVKDVYPTLIDYVTTQTGVRAKIVVQRKRHLIHIVWDVPNAPTPGEYHPTPAAVTQQEFDQAQKSAVEEQAAPSPTTEAPGAPSSPPDQSSQPSTVPTEVPTPLP